MTAHRALIPLSLVTLAAALSGCGGSSSSGASKAAFIKRADTICLRASKAQDALTQPASNAQRAAYVKRVYAIERGVVADLRGLQPPSSDRATVNDMLDSVDRALAFESDVEAAAMGGDQSAINSAEAKGARDLNHATTVAKRYGFKECGNT